jgi:predicted dinucleotide-binding enzyme
MAPLAIIEAAEQAAEAAEHSGLSPLAVGILAMSAFVFLLLVTFSFRSVGSRHTGH